MPVRANDVPNEQELAQTKDERKGADRHIVLSKSTFGGVAVCSTRHAHDSKSVHRPEGGVVGSKANQEVPQTCLLYTSDAADE